MTKTLWKKYPKNDATVKPFLDRFTDFINLFYDFLGAEFNYFHIFISIIFPNLKLLWQSFHFILAISHFCDQIKDFNLGFCLKNNVMRISGIPGARTAHEFVHWESYLDRHAVVHCCYDAIQIMCVFFIFICKLFIFCWDFICLKCWFFDNSHVVFVFFFQSVIKS